MNILGICGAIGWDGNIPYEISELGDFWVHGSGATLIINGELKTALTEERFSRIKYDGNYPKLSIQKILDHNKLTKYDIDLVVYVGNSCNISLELQRVGYIEDKIQEYFPNCRFQFLSHHMAHSAATFYTSGFEEANVLTFDGAGDFELQPDGRYKVPHMKFSQGKDLTLTETASDYCGEGSMHVGFGNLYNQHSWMVYKNKMNILNEDQRDVAIHRETYPGKVMGLAAFGDYQKIDLPEWFSLERERQKNSNIEWEDCPPQLCNVPPLNYDYMKLNPDDLAAWSQYQFEKYLLLFLSNIPKYIKRENLCLGGGCALNILANTKILEQGIYKNVHVNTAPNDDGLHFGAALYIAAEYENKIILPDDIGYLGIPYTDEDIEVALC
jgi:carbamoyltransferase